ncbi:hypothetical protein VSDG_04191 [Cytospora chrysosperma]|uniref:Zn(2)-C6 fungal-type domain-containing protein n=1 Tax=Cytospora chrysosperma TaxID=252740 RepID=A0A423W130_CYTCH|nr:hypothetical protein VSDG_04191 [Valsa sordida]
MATADGKTIRLRASCNACNESKVRCSQSKPTCARCGRNGIDCVYGLSRRTHKDAPPISMLPSSSQRPRGPSRSSSNGDMNNTSGGSSSSNTKTSSAGNSNWRGLSFSMSPAATPSTSTSTSNTSSDLSAGAQDPTLFGDYMSPVGSHFMMQQQQQQQQTNAPGGAATTQFHIYAHTSQVPDSTVADPRHHHPHGGSALPPLLDFSSLDGVTGASSSPLDDPLSAVVTRFPTPGPEYMDHSSGSNPSSNPPSWATTTTTDDMATFWARQMAMAGPTTTAPPSPPSLPPPQPQPQPVPQQQPQYGECACHAGVMELLASSTRGGGGSGAGAVSGRRPAPDAQLARLRRCIAACEASMGCTHGSGGGEDDGDGDGGSGGGEPVHIMAVSALMGHVISAFEVLACETAAAAAGATGGGGEGGERGGRNRAGRKEEEGGGLPPGALQADERVAPESPKARLSWGVLELEDDDEVDLRRRLYMLSFRRLERLLSRLTAYLRVLRDARASLPDPSRHMAFVMACDYTRLWLERRAEDVKRLFMVNAPVGPAIGDEAVDPSLLIISRHMEM